MEGENPFYKKVLDKKATERRGGDVYNVFVGKNENLDPSRISPFEPDTIIRTNHEHPSKIKILPNGRFVEYRFFPTYGSKKGNPEVIEKYNEYWENIGRNIEEICNPNLEEICNPWKKPRRNL